MQENQDEEIITELKDVIDDKYYSYALKLYSQLKDMSSEKSLMLKKEIYETLFEESKKFIDYKLNNRLKDYIKKKNFRLLSLVLETIEKSLVYIKSIILKLDPNEKIVRHLRPKLEPWKKIHKEFIEYEEAVKKTIKDYREKYEGLLEKKTQEIEKDQRKGKEGKAKADKTGKKEKKPKVELLLEMHRGDNKEKMIEYLPFLGISVIRLRILVNEPIKKLIIRPKIITGFYAENIEWSNYICGMNNENIEHDLTKGFVALYGGGKPEGFVMSNPPAESYTFFFLRHHDKKIKKELDYSITFEAIEEISENEETLLSSITIQLKYPEVIRPRDEKELPDYNDPLCPVHAIYKYDYEKKTITLPLIKSQYREITFRGNLIPNYYPRWWPSQKIKYYPIKNKEKISNLVVRSYPDGTARVFYRFGEKVHKIGELFGSLTPIVFNDPLLMTTAEVFRFFSDDFVVIRVWFWWFDTRINSKRILMKHELPDFERVDFVIDLRNPSKEGQMIPYIATDVHWKEFWLDTKDTKDVVNVKFTPIGTDLIKWQQLVAYFSHSVDNIYFSLPAVIYDLFNSIGDPNTFYCVMCGERTSLPANIPAAKELIKDLSENVSSERNRKLLEEMTDIMCPSCQQLIIKEEKLQYLFLYQDYSQFKKNLKKDILDDALAMQYDAEAVEGGGQPLSLKSQNCHVPTPMDGVTSNELVSSTVIKPLSMKRITVVQDYEEKIKKIEIINVSDLEELNQKITVRLAKIGIIKLKDLINAKLSDIESKIDLKGLTEEEVKKFKYNLPRWQQMAELYQIKGIGSQYSDLLVEVGENLNTLKNYSGDPHNLLDKIDIYNSTHNDVSRIPGLKDLESWIQQAKAL